MENETTPTDQQESEKPKSDPDDYPWPETSGGPLGCLLGFLMGFALGAFIFADLYIHVNLFAILAAFIPAIILGWIGWKLGKRFYREYPQRGETER